MRDSWIRLKAGFRGSVIAPLQGLSGPLRGLVKTPDGKTRWVPVGGLAFLALVVLTGTVGGIFQSLTPKVEQPTNAEPSAPVQAAPTPVNELMLRGDDVALNPSVKLTKEGRIPLAKTTSPGELAEAYTRARLNMDMSKDTAQGWLDAEAQWRTSFVPAGFEDWGWTAERQTANRADVFNAWARFTAQAPQFSGFSAGILIDRELASAPMPTATSQRPTWAANIDSGKGIHLVRSTWVASAFATKNATTTAPLNQGQGTTEMLIVCPGAKGFTETSCKVVFASDTSAEFPTSVLKEWPAR